jgi:hypothetical protein
MSQASYQLLHRAENNPGLFEPPGKMNVAKRPLPFGKIVSGDIGECHLGRIITPVSHQCQMELCDCGTKERDCSTWNYSLSGSSSSSSSVSACLLAAKERAY